MSLKSTKMQGVSTGDVVLLVWFSTHNSEDVSTLAEELKSKVGPTGHVLLENVERIALANHTASTFDYILSGCLSPASIIHTTPLLIEYSRLLKPGGKLILREPTCKLGDVTNMRSLEKLMSAMKLNGFTDVKQGNVLELSGDAHGKLRESLSKKYSYEENGLQSVIVVEVNAKKPSFEIGASSQLSLSFIKKQEQTPKMNPTTATVWTLSANEMQDDDVVSHVFYHVAAHMV
jgi:SAM-dependent methyltransferase